MTWIIIEDDLHQQSIDLHHFNLAADFTIKTQDGQDVFFVDGKAFSIGDKLSFQDMQGNELAFIRQKLLAWGPTYEIYRAGELSAVVKKHLFTLFRCRFTVDVPGLEDLEAEGNFLDMEYTFTRCSNVAATVSKRWFTWADTYGVDIADGEDDVLILASTVVIDMICHSDKKR
ncbi:MAG: LURP-one-related family protein [Verrucomicrobia bacterium]|nr:LURP-one-related family protein [Verrucomicrobiota bacterium]